MSACTVFGLENGGRATTGDAIAPASPPAASLAWRPSSESLTYWHEVSCQSIYLVYTSGSITSGKNPISCPFRRRVRFNRNSLNEFIINFQ